LSGTALTAAVYGACAFFGLAIGSFLNVVIYRVPQKLSIVAPPSACPNCHALIRPWDNVPVLSWLWLRGRCRSCHEPISIRYPLVELTTAGLFVATAWRLGHTWELPAFCALLAGLLALAIIDAETLTLPRSVVWVHLGAVAVLLTTASAITGQWRDLVVGALCGLAWSGLYFLMHTYSPRSIGFGDVRFALVLGLSLGYLNLAYPGLAFLVANLLGLVVTLALISIRRLKRDQPVPYGVFLAVGTAVVLYFGRALTPLFRDNFWRAHF
jgi:leader peptidase (prepilin peptidase) / N-methyltransferase